MAANKLAIKARIRSIESTKKITKAMQLVASSKLKKQKSAMEENREYSKYLKETMAHILHSSMDEIHPYMSIHEGKHVVIVFTSDMGLCGGYNANIFRMMKQMDEDIEYIMIGSRGIAFGQRRDYHVIENVFDIEDDPYNKLASVTTKLLQRYIAKEVGKISVLYTHFVNSVSYEPKLETILPMEDIEETNTVNAVTIFEPSGSEMLTYLVPMYVKSMLYRYFLETKTSEQASRRMAMEQATDNAEEIKNKLELEFNKARQAAITQEITEIVGGVNAMEGGSA